MAITGALNPTEDLDPALSSRIKDIDLDQPVVLDGQTSIRAAAAAMRLGRVDLILVQRGGCYGILTSADIRDALAIAQRPIDTPIAEIASWKQPTASPEQSLFHAFLRMTRRGANRLIITDHHTVFGVLELNEVLSFLTNHTSLVIQHIQQATTIADLARAVSHQAHCIHALYSRGVKARYIGWFTQELDRLVFLQAARLLATPDMLEHICILALGSEGRGEQITKTDQDNALIADDDFPVDELRAFGQAFTQALLQLGYPPCPGNVMMSNPEWGCQLGVLQNRITSWVENPNPAHLQQIAIYYDARAVVGKMRLFKKVSNFFLRQIPNDQAFFSHFAMPVLAFDTPLGFFKRFIVEKGLKQGRIDLKKGGIFPIVHGVRSLALEQRLRDPSTSGRIRKLIRLGVLEHTFGTDLMDAFDFISGLRIKVEMENGTNAKPDNDHLQLSSLGHLERENLRDSLAQVDQFKNLLDHHFRLRLLR